MSSWHLHQDVNIDKTFKILQKQLFHHTAVRFSDKDQPKLKLIFLEVNTYFYLERQNFSYSYD